MTISHRPDRHRSLAALVCIVILSIGVGRPARGQPGPEPNVVRLVVRTPHSGFNRMVVSVTLCVPATDRCATIDDVMVDTGSTGLRIEAAAMPQGMRLPDVLGPGGMPVGECVHFVSDAAWGPFYRADVRLGGMSAPDLPIQIIADRKPSRPELCPASSAQPTSNGTLGLGPPLVDCPDPCRQSPAWPSYFTWDGAAWRPVQGLVARADRLPNPVARFPEHNNGIVFDLPAPPPGGAKAVAGTLTFGVGTAPNNQLGAARILRLDPAGRFTTLYGGVPYRDSYIDSGTETYVLHDLDLPECTQPRGAFCVVPDRRLEAEMVGRDGTSLPMGFRVGDYAAEQGAGASDGLAVPDNSAHPSFVWGAPFFLGRRISIVFDGRAVPGTGDITGPFYAFR